MSENPTPLRFSTAEHDGPSTFRSIFFRGDRAVAIRVPDYQRAYSWEEKQIELFVADLVKYRGAGRGYYFGHFIAEVSGNVWEIVDGQQRMTTFVLFLMVCRVLSPTGAHASAYSLIEEFATVSYDLEALKIMDRNLAAFLEANGQVDLREPPSDERIKADFLLRGTFTRSQRRMVLALLRFHQAFHRGVLARGRIGDYIAAVMTAHCSRHLTRDKSVAVNIFEMHNTRGIPLTTLEIIKAMLMKFVYDHGGADRDRKVSQIQSEFGEIYGMEEQVAAHSFRGEMTMEQLLRLHLRVVDDGHKKTAHDFRSPAANATAEALIAYVDAKLHHTNGEKTQPREPAEGVEYALNLARELKKSARVVCEILPEWDKEDPLVGDVLILERDLSCQFFLITCRGLERGPDLADGRIGKASLLLWEKLLFTRDFHGGYYNLKGGRDDFPGLFAECGRDEEGIAKVLERYLADGFRPDRTRGLQSMVRAHLQEHQERVLTDTFFWWWKPRMIYALYKYEVSRNANIREVMKGTISVEHILPQEWYWIRGEDRDLKGMPEEQWEFFRKKIDGCINGVGNLLLITPGENTAQGNKHPAEKVYERYRGGRFFDEHEQSRERWRRSGEWPELIRARGEAILEFTVGTLVGVSQ